MRNALLILALPAALAIGIAIALRVEPEPVPPAVTHETQRADEIVDLVRQGKVGHARALADQFYRAYPRSARGAEIERLTGYHPRPYGPAK